jgi:hypothetical protein
MFKLALIATVAGVAHSMGQNVQAIKYTWMTDMANSDYFMMSFMNSADFGWSTHHQSSNNPGVPEADSGPWTQNLISQVEVYAGNTMDINFSFLSAYMLNYHFEFNLFNLVPIGILFQWDRVTKDNDDMRLFMAPYYTLELLTFSATIEQNAAVWGTSVYDWFLGVNKPGGLWPTLPSSKLSGGIFQSFAVDAANNY